MGRTKTKYLIGCFVLDEFHPPTTQIDHHKENNSLVSVAALKCQNILHHQHNSVVGIFKLNLREQRNELICDSIRNDVPLALWLCRWMNSSSSSSNVNEMRFGSDDILRKCLSFHGRIHQWLLLLLVVVTEQKNRMSFAIIELSAIDDMTQQQQPLTHSLTRFGYALSLGFWLRCHRPP